MWIVDCILDWVERNFRLAVVLAHFAALTIILVLAHFFSAS